MIGQRERTRELIRRLGPGPEAFSAYDLVSLPPPGEPAPQPEPQPEPQVQQPRQTDRVEDCPAPERPVKQDRERFGYPWVTWMILSFLIAAVGCGSEQVQGFRAPDTAGRLTGRVFDLSSGREIAGAFVSLETGRDSVQTLSSQEGLYRFNTIDSGSYRLSVDAGGFQPDIQHLDLKAKVHLTQDVGLRPASSRGDLTGTVVDAVTGVRLGSAVLSIPGKGITTFTDVGGRFSATGIDSGELTVTVQAIGHAPFSARVAIPAGGVAIETFRLAPNAGSIAGLVVSTRPGAADVPLPGVQIRLLEPSNRRVSGVSVSRQTQSTAAVSLSPTGVVTSTGADGRYELPVVSEGISGLTLAAGSHDVLEATTTVITGRRTQLDLRMRFNRATVLGRVLDLTGTPLSGVLVSVPEQGLITVSDAAGRYAFPSLVIVKDFPRVVTIQGVAVLLPQRTIAVGALGAGFETGSAQVVLFPGGTANLDFVLRRATGSLSGQVLRLSDRAPVSGSVVSLPQLGLTTPAASDGSFSFAGLPSAFLTVRVNSVGFNEATTFASILPNQNTFTEILLNSPSSIVGTVRRFSTGAPVVGARVTLPELARQTITDTTGFYGFAGLQSGILRLDVTATGLTSFTTTVTVAEGATATQDVTLVNPGNLTGTVRSQATGGPVVGATVSLPDRSLQTTTNGAGSYQFLDLIPGGLRIDVTSAGSVPFTTTVTIVEGQTSTVNVTLSP